MNNTNIDIVLTGELAEGISFEQACATVEKLFKLSGEQAKQLLDTAPRVIKRGLDAATAEKYRLTIEKAGLKVILKDQADVAGNAAADTTPASVAVAAVASVAPAPAAAAPESTPPAPAIAQQDPPAIRTAIETTKPAAAVTFDGLKFKIDGRPDFGFLTVDVPAGKTLKVEASAMATMDTNLVMKTKMKGGISRMLSGENLFLNEFTAENGPGEIGIAPATPGDLVHRYLRGETLYLQSGAFVASTPGITIETKWQGFTKGFFSGESLFLIRASGEGDLWLNSYGAIIEIDVKDGYVVDTGNIVAFTDGLEYSISKVGGYKSLFFSGEGFVCRFKGEGKLWIQTRSVGAFASWARQYRPAKE
ncbi:TIGR00266 family protein [Undibacterium sp. CY18W]|uniref:TIGR00266 family protein n=1 Tax=Undibacterium hunanense TaxID=2762292 RepID=A0ABR6ZL94_9BURK|nr:TIGR00266 family protein [Undibacterium hunanense]MBC3916670.1 TIGR00266 family protein [Undibacterium hunanense]